MLLRAPWWWDYVIWSILLGVSLILTRLISYFLGGGFDRWVDRFLADYRAGRLRIKDPLLLAILEDED